MAVMTVEQEMEANELSDLLDGFLETLDKRSRIMFVRRYWYSDSISDLAERFQISNNNVSSNDLIGILLGLKISREVCHYDFIESITNKNEVIFLQEIN